MQRMNPYFTDENVLDFTGNSFFVEVKDKRISWNWGAFLFTWAWLFYRKMYLYGLLYLLGLVIIYSILPEDSAYWVSILSFLLFGFFGNSVYLQFAESKISKIFTKYNDPKYQEYAIQNQGGTNIFAAIISAFVLVVFYLYVNSTAS